MSVDLCFTTDDRNSAGEYIVVMKSMLLLKVEKFGEL